MSATFSFTFIYATVPSQIATKPISFSELNKEEMHYCGYFTWKYPKNRVYDERAKNFEMCKIVLRA